MTPLRRPRDFAGQAVWTEEEAAALEQSADQLGANQFSLTFAPAGRLTADRRTSLIVDPPDGTIPPLTPEAQERRAAMLPVLVRPPHGPEDRNLVERCIVGETNGAPLIPFAGPQYNHNVQLFQTPGYVVLLNEMNHDARIVPLDGRPACRPGHPPVAGGLAWPLGGQYAGRGHHEFQRQGLVVHHPLWQVHR